MLQWIKQALCYAYSKATKKKHPVGAFVRPCLEIGAPAGGLVWNLVNCSAMRKISLLVIFLLPLQVLFAQDDYKKLLGKWQLIKTLVPDSLYHKEFDELTQKQKHAIFFLDTLLNQFVYEEKGLNLQNLYSATVYSCCNGGGIAYELSHDTLRIEPGSSTLMLCPCNDAEEYWFRRLKGSHGIEFKKEGFILKSSDKLCWLTFKKVESLSIKEYLRPLRE